MARFQIRDESFGLTLIDAETATEALVEFVRRDVGAEWRERVVVGENGHATLAYNGSVFEAVLVPEGG